MAQFNWLQQWSDHGRQMGHSVFDLQKRMCFHLPNSMILPIRFIETVPDDHFVLNLSGLMRTETMNRAAFYQGKAVFSAFFVPYKQLWHNYNQFVVMKNDKHSTQYKSSAYVPNIELSKLVEFVALCHYKELRDSFGYLASWSMCRLLQFCKLGNYFGMLHFIDDNTFSSWADCLAAVQRVTNSYKGRYVDLWRLLAYQHIFYDFYRNKYYDDTPWFTFYSSGVGDVITQEYIQTFNVDWLACSNEANSHFTVDLDDIGVHGSNVFESEEDCLLANILNVHYCQYRKDLYTSLLPSTQFGAVSGLSFTPDVSFGSNLYSDYANDYSIDSSSQPAPNGDLQIADGKSVVLGDGTTLVRHRHVVSKNALSGSLNVLPSSFDVLELRRAELLQQWKQNALRAGNMVDANFKSHYGVEPYYEEDNNVRFLGQWECNLDVNPVTATGASSGVEVGDLSAFGVGQIVGKDIDVQIKDFGVVVICAHFFSETYYNANGLDKQNTLMEPFDYFQSEFENAGLDSVHAWQQSLGITADDTLDMVFGYTPPYTMYKTEVDEVFGEYSSCFFYDGDDSYFDWQGSLSAWTVKRSDLNIDDGGSGDYFTVALPLMRFYQSPKLTNDVFGVNYDAKGATDPFGFAINIQTKAIRPMSILGIPIFG